jgi:type I restriction enzyme S subunit
MSEWLSLPLKDLVAFQKGKKVEVFDAPVEGGVPYIGASSLEGAQAVLFSHTSNTVVSEDTDVLMLWDGERSGVVGSTVSRLRPTGIVDHKFLYFKLADSFSWIQQNRTGTGVPHVPKDLGKILSISYPGDLIEQREIAKILSTVDNLIGKTQTLIDKYQSIKQGMMHDLFTCGVDENGQLRPSYEEASHMYKESELGWIPREWEVDRLGAVGSFKNGLNKDKDSFGFGTKFVNISDVFPEKLDISSLGRMDATEREQEDYKVSVGDILLDRSSVKLEGVGYPTIFMGAKEPVVFCGFIIRYQIQSPDIIPEFLLLMMRSPAFRQRLIRVATQSANVNINQEALSGVLVAVPTQKEQKKSIDVIECINRDISTELEYLNKLSKLKAGLMQDLLSGKVRVKVDA